MTMPKAMPPITLANGTAIGRYVVVGTLGSGASGTVYRGYDPQLQREVALKWLRPDAPDELGQKRLLREARAMARLDHPNVVAVHDVVADGETITLAMECVPGTTLSKWLETPRRIPEILATLIAAGRGLAAAHAIGLVHRDFKPDNVLVAPDGKVKVTDFGLVKPGSLEAEPDSASDPEREPDPAITELGLVVGTPRYMPPEQCEQGLVDARSDQYAFCVTLWRALCGEHPFRGAGAALLEAKLAGAPKLPDSVAVPSRVARALARGLAVRPEDRFASMEALLDQLEPHRVRWTKAVALGGVLVLGIGGWLVGRDRPDPCEGVDEAAAALWSSERRAELEARLESDAPDYLRQSSAQTATGLDEYVVRWKQVRVQTCRAVHVDGSLSLAQRDLRVGCLDAARIELDAALGVLRDGGPRALADGPALVRDLPELERCTDEERLAMGLDGAPGPGDSELEAQMRETTARLAALLTAGRFDAAAKEGEAAWAASEPLGAHPLRVRIGRNYAKALSRGGHLDRAEPLFREALQLALTAEADFDAARVALEYAFALNEAGRHDEAIRLADMGRGVADRPGAPSALQARALSTSSVIERARGNLEGGLQLGQRALELRIERLGERHPDVAVSRNNLSLVLYDLDRADEAIEQSSQALSIWREQLGPVHPEVGNAHNSLAMVLERAGELDKAEEQYRQALEIRRTTFGDQHGSTIATRHNLGLVLRRRGELVPAERMIRLAVEQWSEALPEGHRHHAIGQLSLGLVLHDLGRLDEAEAALRRSATLGQAAYGIEHPQMCTIWNALAGVLLEQGRREAARGYAERSAALAAAVFGPEHGIVSNARDLVARSAAVSPAP